MKRHFSLLPVVAIIAAILACNLTVPQLSEGKYPVIKSLLVTPSSGEKAFTAYVTLSTHTKLAYYGCYVVWDKSEDEFEDEPGFLFMAGKHCRPRMWRRPTRSILGRLTVANNQLLCIVRDVNNKKATHSETAPFSLPESTDESAETPTATPSVRTAALTFSGATGEKILPNCWEADGTVRLNVDGDGTLQVECGWESTAGFTIHAC